MNIRKIDTVKKKLASVFAGGILGYIGFFGLPMAKATEQKFKVPEYDSKTYIARDLRVSEHKYFEEISGWERVLIDRNIDGEPDLLEAHWYDTTRSGNLSRHNKRLYIDDDFDGHVDRVIVDGVKKDGTLGVDGVYDYELDYSKYGLSFKEIKESFNMVLW